MSPVIPQMGIGFSVSGDELSEDTSINEESSGGSDFVPGSSSDISGDGKEEDPGSH